MSQIVEMHEDSDIIKEVKELSQNLELMSAAFYNKEMRKRMSYNVYNQKHGRRRKRK